MSDFNLGTVTAYGYAKDKGYTGTEAEFAELMASYADVAEQAAESATQAAASATTASTKASEAAASATAAASSKTAAETAQSGAETAAQTATTKAGEASASATTASGKATEATTAAGTATTKASEATTAATTATTKAGEASTSATNAAASATRAQEILDSIPEDYSQLSDDVSDLKDGLTAVKSDVTDLKEDMSQSVNDLKSALDITTPSYNVISDKYIARNGSVQTSSGFVYSEPIPVNKGAKVTLKGRGYLDNVAMISLCDSAGSYHVPVVVSPDSAVRTYEYTCTADGYIAISYVAAVTPVLSIGGENSNSVIAPKVRELVAFTGEKDAESNASPQIYSADHYITKAGVNTSNSSFNVYGVISLNRGDTISVYAKGYLDNVGVISKVQNGVFTVVVASPDSTERTYTYTADSSCDVVISSNKSTTVVYTIDRKTIPESLDELYSNLPDFQELCSLSLFGKFGVVGDSFASGELYFDSSYHDKYNISWGQIMARKHGTTCTNYSSGGQTTRSWLTATKGLPLLLSSEAENIYYLALGINDYYSLGQSYLGTIADITNDYTQNPDTFYGNYARIIEQIQEHAPHAKMVMFTVANTDTVPQMFNDAIIEIAEHYNIPYIVQADDSFFRSEIYTNMVGSHPTAIAHSGMAEAFERLLKKCIVNNRTYFADYMMY